MVDKRRAMAFNANDSFVVPFGGAFATVGVNAGTFDRS